MIQKKCDTIVLSLLDDIACKFFLTFKNNFKLKFLGILNIRGFDIPYNPVVFSFLIINFTDVFLFLDEKKLSPEVQRHLSYVKIFPYDSVGEFLSKYRERFKEENSIVHKVFFILKILIFVIFLDLVA